ncbi:MAG: hypothetical protein ACTHOR_19350, partial [Devosia sp.]
MVTPRALTLGGRGPREDLPPGTSPQYGPDQDLTLSLSKGEVRPDPPQDLTLSLSKGEVRPDPPQDLTLSLSK